jgi:hypothetical protein
MKRISIIGAILTVGVGAGAFGCSADSGGLPTGEPGSPAKTSAADTVSRTIVHVNADGTHTVTASTITRAEQQQEVVQRRASIAARAADAAKVTPSGGVSAEDIILDNDCSNPNSIWLFNSNDFSGDEICFFNDGTGSFVTTFRVDLSQYTYPVPGGSFPWAGSVVSFWAGPQNGCFNESTGYFENANFMNFVPWEYDPDMSTCCGDQTMVYTNILYLSDSCQYVIP